MIKLKKSRGKKSIAAPFFVLAVWGMTQVAPSIEVAWVSGLLIFIIYLFSFEIVSVDVAAVLILVILGLSSLFASSVGLQQGLVPGEHSFD
ncbi:MAG: SLC13 family permease, partial [Proteobacteria bacterium]|nr:SLC13 family permease [Pseudomonadota bacterium]